MHSWENLLPQSTNFEQNWPANAHIKTEPFEPIDIKSNGNMMLSGAQRSSESNPTSPHSVGSDESPSSINYNEALQSLINGNSIHRPLGFNPLTPPGYPNAYRPVSDAQDSLLPTTPSRRFAKTETAFNLTPIHTPPMDQTPPKSPKFRSDVSEKDGTDNENGSISGDDSKSMYSDYNNEISQPKVNSHGKVKTHKCKHCPYVGVTKVAFWEHSRVHIKPERQISCPKCPFVTEFKHHFEYHLRNHDGSKPFKCPECTYTCVNKSMLNSHLKSHSDVYQYRCENCNYATKYVHSLKLHLRKYDHRPAVPLDSEGVPDSAPIIDVYGTRRGPKKRTSKAAAKRELKQKQKLLKKEEIIPTMTQSPLQSTPQPPPPQQQLPSMLSPFLPNMGNLASMFPFFNMQMFAAQQQLAAQLSPNQFNGNRSFDATECEEDEEMNGSMSRLNEIDLHHPESPTSSVPNQSSKIDEDLPLNQSLTDTKSIEHSTPIRNGLEKTENNSNSSSPSYGHHCKFCRITFEDAVMHHIHMGLHNNNDALTCNMCGEKCSDPISFLLHTIKGQH